MESLAEETISIPVDFDPFAEGDVLLTALATESQKEIWASVQMGDDANCAYNESETLRLKGTLQAETLQAAFQELVQRHESLRMTISPDGNTLCINANQALEVPIVDLSNFNDPDRQAQLDSLIRHEVETPFALEHGSLFRATIVRLQPEEHWVLMTAHHIICDGWSWSVLMPDLAKIYSALLKNETPDLEPPDRFSEYALALEEAATSEDEIATENFWLNQFAQSVPIVDLPTDRPRPALRTFNADREDWRLDFALVTNLKQMGNQLGCSFMTTILAGFEVFLSRLLGQEEIIVGVPAAGQAASGNYNLVGHCVNLLPLYTTVTSTQSFSDYLKQRRSSVLDAYDHQQFTFGSLVKKLSIPRDPSRIPLVSILFNIDQALQGNQLPFNGLDADFFSNPRAFENFELFINAVESQTGMVLECQYNTNLFDRETIKTRLAEFETLLAGIVANPDQTIATLPLLTTSEQQLLNQWNQTTAEISSHQCIHQLFEEQALRSPDAIAVVFENEQLTYRELDIRANQLAHYLQSLGVKPETTVGICVERSLEMIVGVLGILKAGGAYVPLDPAYPQERLNFLMQDAQVAVLLTQERVKGNLPKTTAHIVDLDQDWSLNSQSIDATQLPNSGVAAHNLAYIIYTSGSTGKPKGVQIPHQNAVNLLSAVQQQPGLTAQDTLLSVTTLSFDIAVAEVFLPLSVGARLVVVSRDVASDGHQLLDQMNQVKATYLQATPATWRLLLAAGWQGSPDMKIVSTGEALPKELANQLLDKGASLWNLYGPTETTIWSTGYQLKSSEDAITIGFPLLNTQTYILDANLQPVPIGISGELHIGGAGLARGYLNRPELTNEKFIPNPFNSAPNARLYKTGDLARFLPNGQIECLGRIDYQVKVRGYRIELGEIEAALLKHPAVKEAVVVTKADIAGETSLVGYFVPTTAISDDGHDQISELRQFLKLKLPGFMVPSRFMPLTAMPLTANGKVDRKALPKIDVSQQLAAHYIAPRTELEQKIVDLWAEVMGIEKIGIHDNFFELGGHSILAIQVIARLRKMMQIDLPVTTLFALPTVADFADRIETIRWATQTMPTSQTIASDEYEEGEL
jgi:amino acid adenylation domain-containing protein